MHDPIGVRAVLFREFGLCSSGDEVGQYLRLNGSPWFVYDVEWEELDAPLSNPACGITIIYYIIEWYFRGRRD